VRFFAVAGSSRICPNEIPNLNFTQPVGHGAGPVFDDGSDSPAEPVFLEKSGLMTQRVPFIVTIRPDVDRLPIHAAVAEKGPTDCAGGAAGWRGSRAAARESRDW